MIDPIADMLTRIRNASAVAKQDVVLPMSKIKFEIAKILKSEGWINDVEVLKTGKGKRATTVFDELRIEHPRSLTHVKNIVKQISQNT